MTQLNQIANIINAILTAIGLFMGWQGAYNLISAKTEHKPDQGSDAWWTIGLGVFCIATAQSGIIKSAFDAMTSGIAAGYVRLAASALLR